MLILQDKKFREFFDHCDFREIKFLVLHHIEANSANHAIEQLLEHKVSSHFLIDESGKIFELVAEKDIAYHAGVSNWCGVEGLNKYSIGIEFINSSPFTKKFAPVQMEVGVRLCQYLILKYHIEPRNIVGHSDIAYYDRNTELAHLLDRKQDPSHLFDWKFLAQHNVGIFPETNLRIEQDKPLFVLGDNNPAIGIIKKNLNNFGYYVTDFSEEFNQNTANLVRVFNRRFNPERFEQNSDIWYLSSQLRLEEMTRKEDE